MQHSYWSSCGDGLKELVWIIFRSRVKAPKQFSILLRMRFSLNMFLEFPVQCIDPSLSLATATTTPISNKKYLHNHRVIVSYNLSIHSRKAICRYLQGSWITLAKGIGYFSYSTHRKGKRPLLMSESLLSLAKWIQRSLLLKGNPLTNKNVFFIMTMGIIQEKANN